jgi:CheY-like chemotaxis protein
VVDDDPDMRELFAWALRARYPYRVTTACNGLDALAKTCIVAFDAIVTDFWMPVLDGGQLAARLAADERTRHIPIVMASAFAERVPRDLRLSCAAFMAKPCEPDELSRLVALVIEACGPG